MSILRCYPLILILALSIYISGNTQNNSDSTLPAYPSKIDIIANENGIGSLTSKTPFDQNALQIIFPNWDIRKTISMAKDKEVTVYKVFNKKALLLTINPNPDNKTIFSIEIMNNQINNELGPQIGFTYSQVFKNAPSLYCELQTEQLSGSVLCQDPKSKNVSYLFTGKYNGSEEELPPPEILGSWKIKEIIWKP